MKTRSPLVQHSIEYALTNGITSLIAFLVIPLFTWKLTPAAYGIAGLYITITNIVRSSLDYRFLVQKSYIQPNNQLFLHQTMSSCLLIYSVGCLIYIVLALGYWPLLSNWLPISPEWTALACINGFLLATLTLGFALWQMSQSVRAYCLYKFLLCILNALIALCGLYYFSLGWESLAWASLYSAAITLVAGIWYVRSVYHVRWHYNADLVRKYCTSVAKIIPYKLSTILFYYAGPLLVVYLAGLEQSGLYVFALQFGNIVLLFSESILLAILPNLTSAPKAPLPFANRKTLIASYIVITGIIGLLIAIIAPFAIRLIFPAEYANAIPIVLWITLGCYLHAITRIMQELILLRSEKYASISTTSILSALLYIGSTVVLIEQYNGIGGAVGLAVGHGIWTIFTMISAYQAFKPKKMRNNCHSGN